MAMFSDAKVGDRVWDLYSGWAKIIRIFPSTTLVPLGSIKVRFKEKDMGGWIERDYEKDGRFSRNDPNPTLFWDEVKIVPPEKPCRCSVCGGKTPRSGWICAKCHMDEMSKYPLPGEKPKVKEECEACELIKEWTKAFVGCEGQIYYRGVLFTLQTGHHSEGCEHGKD